MKLSSLLRLAINSLSHRKLRSWLTILGIVIGVGSIITLIAIAQGTNAQISARLNSLGNNIFVINQGGGEAGRFGGGIIFGGGGGFRGGGIGTNSKQPMPLTLQDANAIANSLGVQRADARIQVSSSTFGQITYNNKNITTSLTGVEPLSFQEMVASGSVQLEGGRLLGDSDLNSVVLGANVWNNSFNDPTILNKQIRIGSTPFTVVGLLAPTGGTNFAVSDGAIYIPQKEAMQLKSYTSSNASASSILVMIKPTANLDDVISSVTQILDNRHRVTSTNEDFSIISPETIQSTISSVTGTLTLFLAGIASISLLVGGIGIANTMFMSVIERTKEIGILKALGTKNGEISYLFIMEASIIGLIGGTIGILLSLAISFILNDFGVPSMLTPELVVGGLFFSVVIGVVSGFMPARSAANLEPVDALRYE